MMGPDSVGMPLHVRVDCAAIHARTALDFLAQSDTADSTQARTIWDSHARNAIRRCIDRLEDRWDS